MEYQLNESAQVTLNAAGAGSVTIGPRRAGARWKVRTLAVSTSPAVLTPRARVYLGTAAPGSLVGGTEVGSNDADNNMDVELWSGQSLTVVWEAGDPGAVATVSVLGTLYPQG